MYVSVSICEGLCEQDMTVRKEKSSQQKQEGKWIRPP